jgi:hypothetical protein
MIGYMRRHWDGDNSLGYAYWVNGVIVQLCLQFLLLYIIEHTRLITSLASLYSLVALQVAVGIWAVVGIWRSAGNSIAAAKREMRYPIWAYLARVAVVLGVISLLGELNALAQY